MAKVTATKSDQNGLVWIVYLKIGDPSESEKAKYIVEQPSYRQDRIIARK